MRLTGQVCHVEDVSAAQREQMFALMRRHYDHVDRAAFESDFHEKRWVILARDPCDGQIQGFSTQTLDVQKVDGRDVRILFSGDTIVERRYWANNPLAQLWGRLALSLAAADPGQPLYWFLISKGYKTYRFLPVFFREFFPRYDQSTPPWAKDLIGSIAVGRFGDRFCESTGTVAALPSGCRLRNAVADVTPARLKDPHVAFFDRANPGHRDGDELCCLAPLSTDNFNRRAFRVIGSRSEDLAATCRVDAGEHDVLSRR